MTEEKVILQNLISNDEYSRRVIPFIRDEYFHNNIDKKIFSIVRDYIISYNGIPTKEAIVLSLQKDNTLQEDDYKDAIDLVDDITKEHKDPDLTWLTEETERFCKDKAIYNAIMESIHIIDGKSKTQTENAIPNILSDALSNDI